MSELGEFHEYPRWMNHPNEQPAIISDDLPNGDGALQRGHNAPAGRARTFPPVLVRSQDQENYYISRGYVVGPSNRQAAIRAQIAPIPPGYERNEWPKMVDGELIRDPSELPPPDRNYPKWINFTDGRDPVKVNSRAEEAALLPPPPPPEPSEAEREFWAAMREAEVAPTVTHPIPLPPTEEGHGRKGPPRLDEEARAVIAELRTYAEGLGIEVKHQWREAKLRAAIAEVERATAPETE